MTLEDTCLHAIRVQGQATVESVTTATGRDADVVQASLEWLDAESLIGSHEGFTGEPAWRLTPAGSLRHAEQLRSLRATSTIEQVRDAYRRFLELNQPLLQVCTDWQMREVDGALVPNDHLDPEYDRQVIEGLGAIHDDVEGILESLGSHVERYRVFLSRLVFARDRIDSGEHRRFTHPLIDSYHTIWFELHEDLLVTLGIARGEELAEDRDVEAAT